MKSRTTLKASSDILSVPTTSGDTSPEDATMSVELKRVRKDYGSVTALEETDLVIRKGEFVTLLGPSGSGKTTMLNLVSGMTRPSKGSVVIDGRDVTNVAPGKRGLGMVFQHYALMPHMTVFENVAYPLRVRKVRKSEIARRVAAALETVRLPQVADRKPSELSGGQQQRIAIARCLVYEPSIILMDEPLGALDKKLREEMQLEVKHLHEKLNMTALYVTHDQEEALTMSDRIVLMNGGRIEQMGTPNELYFAPRTVFAATFLGDSNLLYGSVEGVVGSTTVGTPSGRVTATTRTPGMSVGERIAVMIRPESATISDGPTNRPDLNRIPGTLEESIGFGGIVKHYVRIGDGSTFVCQELSSSSRAPIEKGASVVVEWEQQDTVLLPPGDGPV